MGKRLKDLRFWILVVFLVQLLFITQPPVDRSHTWRQSLTMMVSRNMANGEGNLFYPRIDHNGATDGIIGMELPVYNAAIAGMIRLFGFQHWYGRLLNVLISLLGVFCFSKLVELISDKRTAFWSGIFLMSSLWLMFMRKIMPDTLSVSLVLIGVWLGWRYYRNGNLFNAAGYFILISLGLLSKIPAAVILAPFGMTVYNRTIPYSRKAVIVGLTFITIVLVAGWYFIWVPELVSRYEYPLYFTRDLATGIIELSLEMKLIISQFIFNSFLSYLGFALFLTGIFLAAKNGERRLMLSAAIAFMVFLYFMIKTGMVFPKHNYYMVPVAPVMALFLGYGAAHFPYRRLKPFVVTAVLLESLANMQHDVQVKNEWYVEMQNHMDEYSDRTELVVCNGGVGPQMMYFLGRRGWTHRTSEITPGTMESHIDDGARWLVLQKPYDEIRFMPEKEAVYSDEHLDIFPLY